ncbi:histone-fold-containing protein [Podospora australis]|uniref:DNA polymerase epsilon subunit D n=1 Tax=Podospora australis TaxID=1536484 RepID=A0AAN6WYV9_9PEZI|nr:histone-fold-containing protein [Podospora australis]
MTNKSRKSDPRPRPVQSDVSAARFVLADDVDTAMTNSPAAPAPAPPTTAAVTIAPAPPTPAASVPQPAVSATPVGTESPDLHTPPNPTTPGPPASVAASSPNDKKDGGKSKSVEPDAVTIEDLALPKSIITRLAKGVLPANTQIQANAILALTKSATVFINYLANAANEHTVSSGKKTIMPADVFKAIEDTEMGFMKERLEAEFAKFNSIQTSKRSTYRKKVAAAKRASTGAPGTAGGEEENGAAGAGAGEASFMSSATGNGEDIEIDDTDTGDNRSFATAATSTSINGQAAPRAAKKAKIDGAAASKMDVDDQEEPSDAETEPDAQVDEDDEEPEDEEEGEEEEEEEEEEDGPGEEGEDDMEERENGGDGDEALDDDSD